MADKKKILILYASAGHGHEKAARAVHEALLEKGGELSLILLDSLTLTRGFFGRQYKKGYLFLIGHFPALWGFFYYLTDIPFVYFFIRPLRRLVNGIAASPLEKKILEENPDVVIATHFMTTEVVSHLKKKKGLKTALVNVVTDYLPHEFWLASGVDGYALGSTETWDEMRQRGIPKERLLVTGIPIEKKFRSPLSKQALRERFGISQGSFAVLVTSGGAGVGHMLVLMEKLLNMPGQLEVLAVCGTNQGLLVSAKAAAEKNRRLHPFGFVDNIQELMCAADVVLGKGGGLTVSESLAIGRPLVLFDSLPGQETRNAECMARHGAARVAKTFPDVLRLLAEFAEKPVLLKQFTMDALKTGQPHAAEKIADLALSLS